MTENKKALAYLESLTNEEWRRIFAHWGEIVEVLTNERACAYLSGLTDEQCRATSWGEILAICAAVA